MPQSTEHAEHVFRESDAAIVVIMIATIVSLLVTSFGSFIIALGSGLAQTQDSLVPHVSNIAWSISGWALVPGIAMFLATLVTRKRPWATGLGILLIISGIALASGVMINNYESSSGAPMMNSTSLIGLIVPVIAGGIVLWQSRRLL